MFEIKKELLPTHEALLEVTFDEETVNQAMRQAARVISRQVNIPGFRRGRAPYTKVVQYVGEAAVLQEAADRLMEETYSEILDKAEVTPYAPGELVDMDVSPLQFKIRVPLAPTVELGDYEAIREDWEEPTVSEEEVAEVLQRLREENVVLEPVERPAEMGDQLMVDVKATVDGEEIVDEDDIEVPLLEDRPFLSPEFVQALLGASAGETRTFPLTLPETMDEPSLRGAEAEFTVTVKQVFSRTLPELDDALASTVGTFESLEALKEDIRRRLLSSKQEQAEVEFRNRMVERLVEVGEFHYPPQMVEEALDDLVQRAAERAQREQKMSLEDSLRLAGLTMEEFRDRLRPEAEQRVKVSLALQKFAELEGIEVSDDEVVLEYQGLFERLNQLVPAAEQVPALDSDLGRRLRNNVLGRKVMDRLAAIGRGKETEEVSEEPIAEDVEEVETSEPESVPEDEPMDEGAETAASESVVDEGTGAEQVVVAEPEVESEDEPQSEGEGPEAPAEDSADA